VAAADVGTAVVAAVGTLVGGGITALVSLINGRNQQHETASAREQQRFEADRSRLEQREEAERVRERQVDDRQREACVAFMNHAQTFVERARALAEAIEEDDNEDVQNEAHRAYYDSWTEYCVSIAAVRIIGPEQLAVPAWEPDEAIRELGHISNEQYRGRPARGYKGVRKLVADAEEAFAAGSRALFDNGLAARIRERKGHVPSQTPPA
jgi:hypothetical protein